MFLTLILRLLIIFYQGFNMYRLIYRSVRPSTDVNFFPFSDRYTFLIKQEIDNLRIVQEQVEILDSGLTQRYEIIWDSFESSQNFNKNLSVREFYKQWAEYSNKNNISLNIISELYYE